jgi:glycosyltransferase involved in cell wall biosynthesis
VSRLAVALDATPLLGPRTGVGEFCAGALGALAVRPELDVSAFAVSWRRRHGIVAELPAGVRAVRRPLPARPVHAAWRRAEFPPIELVTGRVDVVHGTNFVVPPARRAARVVTVHDLTTVRYPELCEAATLEFPAFVRRAVAHGAFVHTPSEFVAGEVVEHFGADPARVRAVLHGVTPVPPLRQGVARDADGGGAPYVLSLGTIEPRKDLPTLVRAFDALAASRPDLWLVVAGRDGWGVAAFESALAACRARARVRRLGYVAATERSSLLASATVFCFPSLYEGFGLPPLEAMAAGVPVVATAAGAVPEVVGAAALLVPPGDDDALAGALAQVLDDGAVRQRLVGAGERRVAELTWERCGDGLQSLYADAVRA